MAEQTKVDAKLTQSTPKQDESSTVQKWDESAYKYDQYYNPQPGAQFNPLKSRFSKTVRLETILDIVRRDDIAYRSLKKVSGDIFDKWFTVIATFESNGRPNDKLKREIEELNARLHVKENFKQAWELKMMLGYSLIGLGWNDSGKITSEPSNIRAIEYINPISQQSVAPSGLVIDLRKGSVTYGKLVEVVLRLKYEKPGTDPRTRGWEFEEVVVPASRILHWVNWAPGSQDPYGMSAFEPIYDVLTVKKNLDWSFGEAAFQFAARKYVLITPANVSPEYWSYVTNNFKDFDSLTTFVAKGENHRVDSFGGTGQLDPRPYYDYYISLLTTGLGIPRTILLHEGGSGAGQEWILKDYVSDIAAIQKTDVEPMLLEFYRRLQENQLISAGNIEFDWNKLIELDEREASFIKSRFALGQEMQARAITEYMANGLAVEFTPEGWIKRVFVPNEGMKSSELILLPPETPPTPKKPIQPQQSQQQQPQGQSSQIQVQQLKEEVLNGNKSEEKEEET